MENRKRLTFEHTVLIPASKKRVWSIMTDLSKLPLLTAMAVEGSLESTGDDSAAGEVAIGGIPYKLRYKPFDFELHGKEMKIGYRLAETREGCKVYAVSISSSEEAKRQVESLILTMLQNLSDEAIRSRRADAEAAAAERQAHQQAEEKAQQAAEETPSEEPAPEAGPTRKEKRSLSSLSKVLLAASILLLCLAAVGALRLKSRYGSFLIPPAAREITVAAAESLSLGMSEGEVSEILSSGGTPRPDGSVVYGAEAGPKVLVVYGDSGASEIRCVLPAAAADADNDKLIDPAADVSAVSDIKSAETALGIPASGFIKTTDRSEIAFGFFDPYCSFASAWKPEYSLVLGAEGSRLARNWDYTSSMPFVVEQLSGTPLAYQYTSQEELVQDMYGYLSCLQLLKGYSKGDIEKVLGGTLVQYQNFANMVLMELQLHDPVATMQTTLEDGSAKDVQAYNVSVSLNDGYFRSATYSNMRIFNKNGMLKGCECSRVTRGMSMAEVQQLMGVLPTSFFYEGESIYLCYGRYIETDVLEEQFEFILRINVAEDKVTNIYDNLAVAAEQDALAGN